MRVTTVGVTAEGGSEFGEFDVELHDGGEIGQLSELWPATGVIFRANPPGYDFDWHNAPRRQLIVMLEGEIEVEVTSGEKRRFSPGDLLLVEDTTGTGHRSYSVDGKPRRSLFIPMPES